MFSPSANGHAPGFDLQSDDWREALVARRGAAEGEHILPGEAPEELELAVRTPMDDQQYRGTLEKLLSQINERQDRAEEQQHAVPSEKPWFMKWTDPAIMLAAGAALCTVVAFGVTSTWNIYAAIDKQGQQTSETLNKITNVLTVLQSAQEQDRKTIEADEKASAARVQLYAPQVEALNRAQSVTDDRLDNVSKSMISLRDQIEKLVGVANQTHTDIEVMKAQTARGH